MKPRVAPDVFAVFAVDPGGTSGWASAVLRNRGSVRQTLRRASRKGTFEAGQTRGSYDDQAWELFELYLGFRYRAHTELGVPVANIDLVIEDFQLRQMAVELTPVEIRAALVVSTRALHNRPIVYQQPSQALSFATSDRLRDWGVWVTGFGGRLEHAADATRHLSLRVAKVLDGLVE